MRQNNPKSETYLDPPNAYNQIAGNFGRLSDARRSYLSHIEQLVASRIPPGSVSLLDVGAGDGKRAVRIAQAASIQHIVLLEPSAEMRRLWPTGQEGLAIRAEELSQQSGSFNVITCLWNVMGHLFPKSNRIQVMRECARLLAPGGRIFIDVNYRYNTRHYGWVRTACRMLRDLLLPGETNGNVRVRWQLNGTTYATGGHVFTHREFAQMTHAAGLTIEEQITVDYQTGQIRRCKLGGNPLFILRTAPLQRPASRTAATNT